MIKKILVYWRDIPSQVIVQRGRHREPDLQELGQYLRQRLRRLSIRQRHSRFPRLPFPVRLLQRKRRRGYRGERHLPVPGADPGGRGVASYRFRERRSIREQSPSKLLSTGPQFRFSCLLRPVRREYAPIHPILSRLFVLLAPGNTGNLLDSA